MADVITQQQPNAFNAQTRLPRQEERVLQIAILGLNFGRTVLEDLKSPQWKNVVRVVCVCDKNETLLHEVALAEELPSYSSLAEMLKRTDLDAVAVFSPPIGRSKIIGEILRAGLDVMTTKPFEASSVAAEEVIKEATLLGRTIHLNSPAPVATPDIKKINEWRSEYDLGRPVAAHAEVYASYCETPDGTWYDNLQVCAAAPLLRLGIYVINDLIHLFGEGVVTSVQTSRIRTQRPTADNAIVTARFGGTLDASIFASFCIEDGDAYRNAMTLHFERGTIYRNVGPECHSAALDTCDLSLVMNSSGRRCVVARESNLRVCGEYDWDLFRDRLFHQALQEDNYGQRIVQGIRFLEQLNLRSAS